MMTEALAEFLSSYFFVAILFAFQFILSFAIVVAGLTVLAVVAATRKRWGRALALLAAPAAVGVLIGIYELFDEPANSVRLGLLALGGVVSIAASVRMWRDGGRWIRVLVALIFVGLAYFALLFIDPKGQLSHFFELSGQTAAPES